MPYRQATPKRVSFTVLILVLVLANLHILVHRNEGYRYFPYTSYSELYITDSTLYLSALHFNGDSLQLVFSQPLLSSYHLALDSGKINPNTAFFPQKNTLTIPLKNDIHTYRLISADNKGLPIEVSIDHARLPETPGYTNEFTYCNLAGPNIKTGYLGDYETGMALFTVAESEKAAKLLREKTHYYQVETDSARIMELSRFVAGLCSNPDGCNFQKLSMLRPSQQLDTALLCRGNLVCGNYTSILLYLVSVCGLPNRGVSFTGSIDSWQYGAHFMTEVFLRDKQQWVLLDAVNKIYLPHDSAGKYLNAADIKKMVQVNGTYGKLAYTFRDGIAKEVPYDSLNAPHYYYNRSNAVLLYAKPNTVLHAGSVWALLDFYGFNTQFKMYSDIYQNDWLKIILKEILLLLLVISVVSYLFFELKRGR